MGVRFLEDSSPYMYEYVNVNSGQERPPKTNIERAWPHTVANIQQAPAIVTCTQAIYVHVVIPVLELYGARPRNLFLCLGLAE